MTRRYCACGAARWTAAAWHAHANPGRPGCREISPTEWAERFAARRAAS